MKFTKYNGLLKFVLVAGLLIGCNEADFSGGATKNVPPPPAVAGGFAEEVSVTVNKLKEGKGIADIVFLLDTSTSMAGEKRRLEENMASFLQKFEEGSGVIDYQVIMIGKDFRFPSTAAGKYEIVERQVESNDALDILQEFLQNPRLGSIQLRPEAVTEVVVVSDANAKMHPRDFESWLLANLNTVGRVHVNGFVGLPKSRQNDWCQISSPGSAYKDLADSANVGGLVQDLCVEDWGLLLKALADQIIVNNVTTEFVLSKEISPGGTVLVTINGQNIDPRHLQVNFEKNSVLLDGTVTPKVGDTVSVKYIAN